MAPTGNDYIVCPSCKGYGCCKRCSNWGYLPVSDLENGQQQNVVIAFLQRQVGKFQGKEIRSENKIQ